MSDLHRAAELNLTNEQRIAAWRERMTEIDVTDPQEPVYDEYHPVHPGWRDNLKRISKLADKVFRRVK